jgi:hypothetical protein
MGRFFEFYVSIEVLTYVLTNVSTKFPAATNILAF